jgi:hypothetical protein
MFQTSATQSTKGRPRMPPRKDFRDCGNRRDDNACQKPRPSRWAKIQARPLYPVSITRPPVVGPLMASGSTKSVRTFTRCHPEEAESFATRKDPDEGLCIPDNGGGKTCQIWRCAFTLDLSLDCKLRMARNARVFRLLSPRFGWRKTALRMTAFGYYALCPLHFSTPR